MTASTYDVAEQLHGQKLPAWTVPVIGGVAVAVGVAMVVLGALHGTADGVVVAALIFLFGQTAASFLVEGRRQAKDRMFTTFIWLALVVALVPLGLIVWKVVSAGAGSLTGTFLGHSMFTIDPSTPGGGEYHAIIGTLEQGLIATAIAAPLGVLCAVYLVEYGAGGRFARLVSFFVDVMVGVPSIVAGLFVFTAWILVLGFQKSGFAGSLALFILMLPLVIRSTEEMLRLVSDDLRESAYALGVPKWRTIMRIVLPTALGGVVTGIMLGVARIMGETAPLLLLIGINQKIQFNPFAQVAQDSLPTFIYEQFQVATGSTTSPAYDRAWGAALTLIIIIMLLTAIARIIARFSRVHS
ncbi:MAG: phosphate ABC transporter permease PstA [Mycobacteriales bacterium]